MNGRAVMFIVGIVLCCYGHPIGGGILIGLAVIGSVIAEYAEDM